MGQGSSVYTKEQITPEKLQFSIHSIFDSSESKSSPTEIALPINRIIRHLTLETPCQQVSEGFHIDHVLVKIFHHKNFAFTVGKLLNLLVDKLEQIMQRSSLMVTKNEWQFCQQLSEFILTLTDDKLINLVETASVRNDLTPGTKKLFEQLEKNNQEYEASQHLINRLVFEEIEKVDKCLRISLHTMISMRQQFLTKTQDTLNIIGKFQCSCFILYLKVLYSPEHSHTLVAKAKHEYLKTNLNIVQYFMGRGLNEAKSSVYESSILFLTSLLEQNKKTLVERQFKALPSHLFKNLPIISQTTVYDFLMCTGLFALTYVKEGTNFFSRILFNRIMTLKMIDMLLREVSITSQQITFYLEEVCLQTKIGQIERSFVTDIVKKYVSLVEFASENKQKNPKGKGSSTHEGNERQMRSVEDQPVKPESLKYLREAKSSEIMAKYLQSGAENYNVKYSNKKFKITTDDILTELENDDSIIQTEFKSLCNKFIFEVILGKKVSAVYNDRQLWNEILPNILEGKGDSSDESDREQSSKEEQPHQAHTKMEREPIQNQQQPKTQASRVAQASQEEDGMQKPSSEVREHQTDTETVQVEVKSSQEQIEQPTDKQKEGDEQVISEGEIEESEGDAK